MEENRDEIRDKRLDNLIPFEAGKSGNPKGRPKGQRNYATIYREALEKLARLNNKSPEDLEVEILSTALANARKGNYQFYKDIMDRLHGQATQKTDISVKELPKPIMDITNNNVRPDDSHQENNSSN